jgi:hypothetical protein
VVHHRSHSQTAATQRRHNLRANAADSPAGASHQDETRLSHRLTPFVVAAFQSTEADPVISSLTVHQMEYGPSLYA